MGDENSDGVRGETVSQRVTIRNRRGLHARASAKFVQLCAEFEAEVTVTRGEVSVGGQSIMGLMMLAAGPGTEILIEAAGPQKQDALSALAGLVIDQFDETD